MSLVPCFSFSFFPSIYFFFCNNNFVFEHHYLSCIIHDWLWKMDSRSTRWKHFNLIPVSWEHLHVFAWTIALFVLLFFFFDMCFWYCYEGPYPILHSFFLFSVIISGWSIDSRHYIFFLLFFFLSFFLLLTTYFWHFLPALTKRLYIYIVSFFLCHEFSTCMSFRIGGVYWEWLVLCHEVRTFYHLTTWSA